MGPTLVRAIRTSRPEVIWPVLHEASGEDGALRDVLKALGIPHIGSGPDSCRLTWDKPVAKALVGAAGVSTPDSVSRSHATFRELGAPALLVSVVESLGLPLAVKPARGGTCLGLTIVQSDAELPSAMVTAYAFGDIALIERLISGVEVAISASLPAYQTLGHQHLSRVDLIIDADDLPWFLEANVSRP